MPRDDDHEDVPVERAGRFDPEPEKVAFLREIAEDVRGETGESKQIAALLYRISDLYDPDEETDPRHIYVNMREILRVKERGGREG